MLQNIFPLRSFNAQCVHGIWCIVHDHKKLGFLSVSLHLMPQISWLFLLPTVGLAMLVKCEPLIFTSGSASSRSCRELSVTIPNTWRVFSVRISPSSLEKERYEINHETEIFGGFQHVPKLDNSISTIFLEEGKLLKHILNCNQYSALILQETG